MPAPKKTSRSATKSGRLGAIDAACSEVAAKCPGVNRTWLFTAMVEGRPDFLEWNVSCFKPDAGTPSVVVAQLRELASAADQLASVINGLHPGALEVLHRDRGVPPDVREKACLVELPDPTDRFGPRSRIEPDDFEDFDELFSFIESIEKSKYGSGWMDRLEAIATIARAKASAVERHTRQGGRKRMDDYLHGFEGSIQKAILARCESIVKNFGLDPKYTLVLARAMYRDMTGEEPKKDYGRTNLRKMRQTPPK